MMSQIRGIGDSFYIFGIATFSLLDHLGENLLETHVFIDSSGVKMDASLLPVGKFSANLTPKKAQNILNKDWRMINEDSLFDLQNGIRIFVGMPSKNDPTQKPHSADDITGEDILTLYKDVLPLLYSNPENVDLTHALNKSLLKFIDYKLWHWLVSDFQNPSQQSRYSGFFDKWGIADEKDLPYSLTAVHSETSDSDDLFNKTVIQSYENMVRRIEEMHNTRQFTYYRIRSANPDIMVGFFRLKTATSLGTFSKDEEAIIEKLKPHIFLILQTITVPKLHSETFNFYNSYIKICSTIANDHSLTATEGKLLPEILFGYTNAQIAERNFISVPTVKKHLKHIFKKTQSKNRMDFIGKFFTSPEKIEL